jgi:hypothetical protein
MIKRDLLRHRFATNLDYTISSVAMVNGIETRITTHIPLEFHPNEEEEEGLGLPTISNRINDLMDIERELSLHFSDDLENIEDTMEADLLEISENMSQTMGFSHITFPLTYRAAGNNGMPAYEQEVPYNGNNTIFNDIARSIYADRPLTRSLSTNTFTRTITEIPSFIKKYVKKHYLSNNNIPDSIRYNNSIDYNGNWFEEHVIHLQNTVNNQFN